MPATGFGVIVCVMESPQVGFVAWGWWGAGQDSVYQVKCLSKRGEHCSWGFLDWIVWIFLEILK